MSKKSPTFMSMAWMNQNGQLIIWTITILFILSLFAVGFGSLLEMRNHDKKQQEYMQRMEAEHQKETSIPESLKAIENEPVAEFTYKGDKAAYKTVLTVKQFWNNFKQTEYYDTFRAKYTDEMAFYEPFMKDQMLNEMTAPVLLHLYAKDAGLEEQANLMTEANFLQVSREHVEREAKNKKLSLQDYLASFRDSIFVSNVMNLATSQTLQENASEEELKNYYEKNKGFFKDTGKLSMNHLLVAPKDFDGRTNIDNKSIRSYYESHKNELMSSNRVQVSHILIDAANPLYIQGMPVNETEAEARYQMHQEAYKQPEKVRASHILIKPKNTFSANIQDSSISISNFSIETDSENAKTKKAVFYVDLENMSPDTIYDYDDFTIVTNKQNKIVATPAAAESITNNLQLPIDAAESVSASGYVAFYLPESEMPETFILKSKDAENDDWSLTIANAFDIEKAFAAAKTEIERLAKEVEDGKPFGELAKRFSEDPGSATKGGSLGLFQRGVMVKPFEETAFAQNPGEVSAPIRTAYGYHIIKTEEKLPESITPFSEVKAQIINDLKKEKAAEKAQKDLNALKLSAEAQTSPEQKKKIFKDGVQKLSTAKSKEKDGLLPPFFKGVVGEEYSQEDKALLKAEICGLTDSISTNLERVIFNLEKDQISEVLSSPKGYHLFYMENNEIEPVQRLLGENLTKEIKKVLEDQAKKNMANLEAAALYKNYTTFGDLASAYKYDQEHRQTYFKDLPYNLNPSPNDYSLAEGLGMFTTDGRTFVKPIMDKLESLTPAEVPTGIIKPFQSEFGTHIVQFLEFSPVSYKSYDEVKDDVRRIAVMKPLKKEIQELFEEEKDSLATPAMRRVRQVFLYDEADADIIYKQLSEGEAFDVVVQRYYARTGQKSSSRVITVTKDNLAPELAEAIWQLNPGEYTKPVKSNEAYIITLMTEPEKPAEEASFEKSEQYLTLKLQQQNRELLTQYLLKSIQDKTEVNKRQDILDQIRLNAR
ncbi:MAG: hypothetical protein GX221_08145 [Candidatus Riflebacteria bacterium]|nr:hypothetical protein [Candidatus Riflebacteria bacterium]